jgi:hypothetical protein
MEDFLKNLVDTAKDALGNAGEKLNELKDAATEKAEALAAEAKAEAAEKAAELMEAKEKIAGHEGGALGFLTDKAKDLMGGAQEGLASAAETGKDFWEKAKDFASDKLNDAKDAVTGKDA